MRKRSKLRRNFGIHVMQNFARRRGNRAGIGVAQHRYRDKGKWTLKQVSINRRARGLIETVFVNVADDPDNREQPQIAVHVPELDRMANWVLPGPAFARQ